MYLDNKVDVGYVIDPPDDEMPQIEEFCLDNGYRICWLMVDMETFQCGRAYWERNVLVYYRCCEFNISWPPLPNERKPLWKSIGDQGEGAAILTWCSEFPTGYSCDAAARYGIISGWNPAEHPNYRRQAWLLPCWFQDGEIPIHPLYDREFTDDEWALIHQNTLDAWLDAQVIRVQTVPQYDNGWTYDALGQRVIETFPAKEPVKVIDIRLYKPASCPSKASAPFWAQYTNRERIRR